MRRSLCLICVVLLGGIFAPNARAEWPRVNPKLKAGQVKIHTAVLLPAEIDFRRGAFAGVVGGAQEGGQLADILYFVVSAELMVRGVTVLPNPLDAAQTEADKFAIADLEARYDAIAATIRKDPGRVEQGRVTLDDGVAAFAPGAGSDALVFIRGNGSNKTPFGSLNPVTFRAEVTLVDAKTGDVLALVRFGFFRDVTWKPDQRLARALLNALREVPLPEPAPKR